jgi:hypothetical protein
MKQKSILLFLLTVILLSAVLYSKSATPDVNHKIDSLQKLLNAAKDDSTRVRFKFKIEAAKPLHSIESWEYLRLEAEKHHMFWHEIYALNGMSKFYADSGEFSKATDMLSRALAVAEKHEDHKLILEQIARLYSLYSGRADRKKSLYYIMKGLKLSEEFNDKENLYHFYADLSLYYYVAGDHKKALKMYFQSLKKAKELKYDIGIVGSLLDIGTAYSNMNMNDKAAYYYLESQKYISALEGTFYIVEAYSAIGVGYRLRKEYDSAEYYAQKAYEGACSMQANSSIAAALVAMAWLEDERGHLADAKKHANEALVLSKRISYLTQLPSIYQLLKSIYTKEGNYKKALEYYELYIDVKDSLSNEEARKLGAEKEFEFNLEKKENENTLLVQQNEIQELELKQDKYLATGAGIIAVILILISYLFTRQSKYKADHQRVQLEQKLLRAQMNPHFVFNSLNSIQQFIMGRENNLAEQYLFKFATLMRDLLESNIKDNIMVAEETSMLSAYLEMEALRFGSRFSYSITIDDRIGQGHSIPHLMIQPFVENAIWHGLLPKPDDRMLQISFEYDTPKTIKCIVDDNGVGREASAKRESTFRKKSLALSFVNQRMELIKKTYRIEGSVTIIDKKDEKQQSKGTRVVIVLPILKS